METKEQMELRLQKAGLQTRISQTEGYYHTMIDDIHTIYDKPKANQHPHWIKIMMLYRLINKRTHGTDKKMVGRIIDRIQRYGTDYKLKKRDYVLMNKLYKIYK